ncbi:hypothetical protein BMR07_12930 [Methylococcaceae bacterium CS1]|nr:hypothetical protein BMR11_17060 [Methylococcaceae bacterium CS5]TXL02682.1 hypothetical protein BMR09_16400 [Methylococcaceae bacterium CS3]TXL04249.1 hypothetical protein BMR07_12930 [Methylococcaceae bacterium CS1]
MGGGGWTKPILKSKGRGNIKPDSVLVKLVKESAEKLFFLSNKSKEQITDDYKMLSSKVSVLTKRIQQEMSRIK